MNIAKINEIFSTRGAAAALATATVAQMDDWIIAKLKAGEWEPGRKPEPKPPPRESRQVVDRNGDKRIVKVSLGTDFLGYVVETLGESGDVVSAEGFGKLSLAEARALIGKSISHPVSKSAGKTNVPGQGPKKGPSPPVQVHGSGQPKKNKGK